MMKLPKVDFNGWKRNRAVNKAKENYRYTLLLYAKRHKAERNKEDMFLIVGLIVYVTMPIIAVVSGLLWLTDLGIFIFLGAAFFPFIASFWNAYILAKKLTITMKVVANNPEETRPVTLLLEGVEFGAGMSSTEDLIKYVHKQNGHLTHSFVAKDGEAHEIMQRVRDRNMKLYPMMAKGDTVPALVMFPDDPEKILRAREERVRLTYGPAGVRHATMYVLESQPVKTSILIDENAIVDVEYALFLPIFTQSDLDGWLKAADWHLPNRVAQEVATHIKQSADTARNAPFYQTLQKQRDDAVKAYNRLLLHQQFSDIEEDVETDVFSKMRGKKHTEAIGAFVIVLAFAVGLVVGLWL